MPSYDPKKSAWRIVADATPEGGKRRRVVRLHRAPNTDAGRHAAEVAEARLRDDVALEIAGPRSDTFAAAARRWQRAARSKRGPWSPGTRRTVAEALDGHILPALGDRLADDVTPADIEDLYARWSEYLAPSNIRRKHGMIRKIYADLERRGEITHARNPMHRVEAGGGVAPERIHMPTPANIHALADDAGERSLLGALFVYVAAYTGARRGSVLALRWRNIDLDGGLIRVERALTLGDDGKAHEKGNKAGRPYPVRISGRIVELLREARRRAAESAIALGEREAFGDLYVFTDDGGRTPWSVSHPSKVFRLAARNLGLSWSRLDGDGGMTLHDLRHYAASTMLAAGVPVPVVAARLGCTVANVQATYSHYIPSREDERAADVMAGALG
jgi:integrase